jgi:ArsR family transcriptional regulator
MIDLDAIFRALAHPFRRQVLQWLGEPAEYFPQIEHSPFRGVSAGMIQARGGLSQSTVSSHLSQLERAGLLNTQRAGQWVFLSRNEEALREFSEWLRADFARTHASVAIAAPDPVAERTGL